MASFNIPPPQQRPSAGQWLFVFMIKHNTCVTDLQNIHQMKHKKLSNTINILNKMFLIPKSFANQQDCISKYKKQANHG